MFRISQLLVGKVCNHVINIYECLGQAYLLLGFLAFKKSAQMPYQVDDDILSHEAFLEVQKDAAFEWLRQVVRRGHVFKFDYHASAAEELQMRRENRI